jgi:hypothetical protein
MAGRLIWVMRHLWGAVAGSTRGGAGSRAAGFMLARIESARPSHLPAAEDDWLGHTGRACAGKSELAAREYTWVHRPQQQGAGGGHWRWVAPAGPLTCPGPHTGGRGTPRRPGR